MYFDRDAPTDSKPPQSRHAAPGKAKTKCESTSKQAQAQSQEWYKRPPDRETDHYKCQGCQEVRHHRFFTESQKQKYWRGKISSKKASREMFCVDCTSQQQLTFYCFGCDATKSKDDFATNQTNHSISQLCIVCQNIINVENAKPRAIVEKESHDYFEEVDEEEDDETTCQSSRASTPSGIKTSESSKGGSSFIEREAKVIGTFVSVDAINALYEEDEEY